MTTKEKILDTALELFSRHGYDGASVRDIARAVGIRESSLYNHFPSKRALFDGIVDFCVQQAELYFRGSGLPFDQGDDTSLYRRSVCMRSLSAPSGTSSTIPGTPGSAACCC